MTCNQTTKAHAIALFSGGLDSVLAILLMRRQGIRVTALRFESDCNSYRSPETSHLDVLAERFGFDLRIVHLGQRFIEIVEHPSFGRGDNMNPCLDCRILMLREAADYMNKVGADFIISGEVLGQRPFSQLKDRLNLVANHSNLKGLLLRPLSARLLPPTKPEIDGLVDREGLEAISGRGRRRQMELAGEFDLDEYPNPAGGCLLTDPGYSRRLEDLMAHSTGLTRDDVSLLRVGRHLRLDKKTKLVVGRNEEDNGRIALGKQDHHYLLEAIDVGSPLTLLIGNASPENIRNAAGITARYSSARDQSEVRVSVTRLSDNSQTELSVTPADKEFTDSRIIR